MIDNEVRLSYHNLSGMRGNIDDLYLMSLFSIYNVIVLTETWLNETFFNAELMSKDWTIYRTDRDYEGLGISRGGGVLIAIHNSLANSMVDIPIDRSIEQVWAKIKTKCGTFYLAAVYIPPSSQLHFYEKNIDYIQKILELKGEEHECLILGDFNLKAKWVHDQEFPDVLLPVFRATSDREETSSIDFNVIKTLLEKGFNQVNPLPNELDNYLDLVFYSGPVQEINVRLALSHESRFRNSRHHNALVLDLELDISENMGDCTVHLSYDFMRTNYNSINDALLCVDWGPLNFLDLDDATDYLYGTLHSICRVICPVKKNCNKNYIPWMTPSLRNLKNRRDRARKKMSPEHPTLAAEFDMQSKLAHLSYKNHIGQDIINDPKKLFSYVNSTRKTDGYPKTLRHEGVFSSDPSEISNMFAKTFQNAYRSHSDTSVTDMIDMPESSLFLDKIHLSREKFLNGLLSLQADKSADPDGFPNMFLVHMAGSLLEPLYILFNRSLSLGYFPSKWKSSYVTPIYKKGNRSDVGNYRCIAKLPAIPKLFESLVCDEIKPILEPILQKQQHGFVKGRSTVTNLSCLIHFIHEAFRDGNQVDVLYTDFSKAFDKVDHTLLLRKLHGFGVKGEMLTWLQSYLTGRTQHVKFRGQLSDRIFVTSGVPQGSHLGPLLFNLHLVDMSEVLSETPHWILADDTKFGKVIKNTNDCINFQGLIDAFVNWCTVNLMDLNDSKCCVISFRRRGQLIDHDYEIKGSIVRRVEEIMDLGVLLDKKLEFDSHIEMICCKAYCMLAYIKRKAKEFDNMWVTQALYITLVRSILEYALLIWMLIWRLIWIQTKIH